MEKEVLKKAYVILVNGDEKSFKAGDIISKGSETKIATSSSRIFNFKNWGYTRKDIVFASIGYISPGSVMIYSNTTEDKTNIVDFKEQEIRVAKTSYAAGVQVLKVIASTGHETSHVEKISPEFVKIYFNREGGIKVTNVVVQKDTKDQIHPKLDASGFVITKPIFKKFNRNKKRNDKN